MAKKTLIPNDFRDFLSIISIFGFVAIFFEFVLGIKFVSDNMNVIFLIIGGLGVMTLSKVFTIRQWVKNGIQRNETLQSLGAIIGTTMVIIGILLAFKVNLGSEILGYVGIISLFPALFITLDYIAKNN